MIETWKYLHGQYHVNQMPLQRDTNTTTRGHSMKLRKERCLKRQRSNFFRHRVVNRWNMLTDNIVTSPSVNIFKNRLDAFWHVHKCEQSDDFPRTCTKHPSRPANRLLAYLRAEEDVCMYVCITMIVSTVSSWDVKSVQVFYRVGQLAAQPQWQ